MAIRAKQATKEADIKAEYATLEAERRYHRDYILKQLAQKYYMEPGTIERIIWGEYDTRRARQAQRQQSPGQTSLFA